MVFQNRLPNLNLNENPNSAITNPKNDSTTKIDNEVALCDFNRNQSDKVNEKEELEVRSEESDKVDIIQSSKDLSMRFDVLYSKLVNLCLKPNNFYPKRIWK